MACFRIRRQSPPATGSNHGNILGLKNVAMKPPQAAHRALWAAPPGKCCKLHHLYMQHGNIFIQTPGAQASEGRRWQFIASESGRRQSLPVGRSILGNILGAKNVAMETAAGHRRTRHHAGQIIAGVNHTVVCIDQASHIGIPIYRVHRSSFIAPSLSGQVSVCPIPPQTHKIGPEAAQRW